MAKRSALLGKIPRRNGDSLISGDNRRTPIDLSQIMRPQYQQFPEQETEQFNLSQFRPRLEEEFPTKFSYKVLRGEPDTTKDNSINVSRLSEASLGGDEDSDSFGIGSSAQGNTSSGLKRLGYGTQNPGASSGSLPENSAELRNLVSQRQRELESDSLDTDTAASIQKIFGKVVGQGSQSAQLSKETKETSPSPQVSTPNKLSTDIYDFIGTPRPVLLGEDTNTLTSSPKPESRPDLHEWLGVERQDITALDPTRTPVSEGPPESQPDIYRWSGTQPKVHGGAEMGSGAESLLEGGNLGTGSNSGANNTTDFGGVFGALGGLATIASGIKNKGTDPQKALRAAQGLSKVYNAVASAYGKELPGWVGPVLAVAEQMAAGGNTGENLARGAAQAIGAYGTQLLGPVGGSFFGEGIGKTVGAWLEGLGLGPELTHAQREAMEVGDARGSSENLLEEALGMDTREGLWSTLERYKHPSGGISPILHNVNTVEGLFDDPTQYTANVQAGVTPSSLADSNSRVTDAVRRQVALIRAAEAGNAGALAELSEGKTRHQDTLKSLRNVLAAQGENPDTPLTKELMDRVLGGRGGVARNYEEYAGLTNIADLVTRDNLLANYDADSLTAGIRGLAGISPHYSEGVGGGFNRPPREVIPEVGQYLGKTLQALAEDPRRVYNSDEFSMGGVDPVVQSIARAMDVINKTKGWQP